MRILPLLAAAALVVTAGACATPQAEKSAVGERAGATAKSGGGETKGEKKPWWRLSQYSRPGFKPEIRGDIRPGKGLFGGEDGIVLYRKGEANPSDPSKPTKVRR